MRKETLMPEARELANKIMKDLLKNYQGQTIKKSQVRVTYNIAWTKSAVVFAFIEKAGFTVSERELIVPVLVSDDSSSPSLQEGSSA